MYFTWKNKKSQVKLPLFCIFNKLGTAKTVPFVIFLPYFGKLNGKPAVAAYL